MGLSSIPVMAEANGSFWCKTCLPAALQQESVQLVLPSWELLSYVLVGAKEIHKVQLLVHVRR